MPALDRLAEEVQQMDAIGTEVVARLTQLNAENQSLAQALRENAANPVEINRLADVLDAKEKEIRQVLDAIRPTS